MLKSVRIGFGWDRGSSLVEVMVAITILGILLVGMMPTTISTLGVGKEAQQRTEAAALAEQGMEIAREADLSSVDWTVYTSTYYVLEDNAPIGEGFQRTIKYIYDSDTSLVVQKAAVTWINPGGLERVSELTSLRTSDKYVPRAPTLPTGTVKSIRIAGPSYTNVFMDQNPHGRITVLGLYADGEYDVTSLVSWVHDPSGVITIAPDGSITAIKCPGYTDIYAKLGTKITIVRGVQPQATTPKT